jgi:hypothetical protein
MQTAVAGTRDQYYKFAITAKPFIFKLLNEIQAHTFLQYIVINAGKEWRITSVKSLYLN